jgi:hypothetical protein
MLTIEITETERAPAKRYSDRRTENQKAKETLIKIKK